MPSNIFWGMQHLNENLLCAIQIDMTGPDLTFHELVEIAVVPLSHMLEIHLELPVFNMRMKPESVDIIDYVKCRLTRQELSQTLLSGFSKDKVADFFINWYYSLNMGSKKKLLPLAYNWPLVRHMLIQWLGLDVYNDIFHEDARDVRMAAHFVNDRECCKAEPAPFAKQTLPWLATKMDIQRPTFGGNATEDCMTIARVYRQLLRS